MKTLVLAVMMSLVASQVFAYDLFKLELDPMDTQDWVLQGVFVGAMVVDWAQTREISRRNSHPKITKAIDAQGIEQVTITTTHEHNPVLGQSPSITVVDAYFVATTVLHSAVTILLPKELRPYWQCVWIGVEVGAVVNNLSVGVKLGF